MNEDLLHSDLPQKFAEHIAQEQLFSNGDKILLTVSGGVDSTVLAELFHRTGLNFGIAHCNFQLRGSDSLRDQNFVENLAVKYHVPLHLTTFETTAFAKEKHLSIEEAARNLRYGFFEEIRQKLSYRYIATAHHCNDSIETFFINLLRGTGITGLHGIRPKNGNIIRPLLPFTRSEILGFALENGIDFCEDCTNNDTTFLRNRIRHTLVPILKEISPAFERTMQQNIEHLAEVEAIYKNSVKEKQQQILQHSGNKVIIPKNKIEELDNPRTYLFEMLRPFGFNASTTENILQIMNGTSGKLFHSGTHTLLLDRSDIIIKPNEESESREFPIDENTECTENPICLIISKSENYASQNTKTSPNEITVDAKKIQYPLKLRKWQAGDRFQPFGMKGCRKVSDFFKDLHLSRFEKERKWILCNADNHIIWIVGMRMDDTFKVTPETKKILKIKFEE